MMGSIHSRACVVVVAWLAVVELGGIPGALASNNVMPSTNMTQSWIPWEHYDTYLSSDCSGSVFVTVHSDRQLRNLITEGAIGSYIERGWFTSGICMPA